MADSSAIAAILKRVTNFSIKGFQVTFDEATQQRFTMPLGSIFDKSTWVDIGGMKFGSKFELRCFVSSFTQVSHGGRAKV